MSFLSRISLANRSLVALATIAILIVGGFLIPSLKQELYPSLEFPAVTVRTFYPGASPSVVEQSVTDPLEQSIQGTSGVQSLTSYSNQNVSIIVVSYDYGADLDQASQKLSQKISSIQLPSGVNTPQIQTFNINDFPIIQLAVTSNTDTATLAAALKSQVEPVLSGLSGVASVNVTGVRAQVVTIALDSQKMALAGLSIQAIQSIFQQNNINFPAGQVTNNGQTLPVTVSNSFKSLADLQNLIVGSKSNCPAASAGSPAAGAAASCGIPPTPIKLSDIATVEQTLAPSTTLTRTNGQPSLGISITKSADGNTVTISNEIRDKIDSLQNQLGNGAKITIISDQAPSITSAVTGLVREGLIGAAFAILVILLFLFSLRSTLVTAISIPLSIVIALIGLSIGKLTLNLFTLGALTIAVGRVVDDSIVVLENIYRHLNQGEDKQTGIPAAVREVAGAVTSSTITTVAVFLPIAFTGGLVGEVFGPFAITVTVALLASLFVALTIIPVLAYWFLKTPDEKALAKINARHEKDTFLERGYIPMVRWVTAHKVISLVVAFVLFFGSLAIIPRLGTNFFSASQANTYTISQTLPVGTSLDVTDTAIQKVEAVLHGFSQIQTYQVTAGGSGGLSAFSGNSGGANSASFSITTDPNADQTAFQNNLQSSLNALSDAGTIKFSASSGGFNSSGIAVNVQAPDQDTLTQATQQVMDAVSKVANLTNVSSNLAAASPLISVTVDQAKAAAHNLSTYSIGQYLNLFYTGTNVATVNFTGAPENVNMQLANQPVTVAELQNVVIFSQTGPVKLGDIATITQTVGPTQITHIGGTRTATVSASATTNNVGGVNSAIQKQLDTLSLPAGATVALGGVSQSQSDAFNSLGLALLIAILLVFLVMVATFRSLVQPLILLVSIPFAASGSLFLMLITHTELGVPSLIGLLMLVGIVVTNAIVLIDLVRQYRAQGMDARTAVIEGGKRRLRPILMTAIATILALMPMALGLSKDSGFIAAPLAITVIGGLTSSTILTLLLVPTLYVLVEGRKDRKTNIQTPEPAPLPIEEQVTGKQEVIQGA